MLKVLNLFPPKNCSKPVSRVVSVSKVSLQHACVKSWRSGLNSITSMVYPVYYLYWVELSTLSRKETTSWRVWSLLWAACRRTWYVAQSPRRLLLFPLTSAFSPVKLNEAELHVSDEASYKQKLEVLQQQQELIEDEAEQEKVFYNSFTKACDRAN